MESIKISAILGTLGQLGDRFMAGGYKDEKGLDFETIIKELAELNLIEALELCYSGEGMESDSGYISSLMKKYGYDVSFVFPALHCQRQWQDGTLRCSDKQTRKQAIDFTKKTMDFDEKIGAAGVSLWLGQDGHDYPLQTDYKQQWENLTSTLK